MRQGPNPSQRSRGSKYFSKLLDLDLRFRFLFSFTHTSSLRSLELETVDFWHFYSNPICWWLRLVSTQLRGSKHQIGLRPGGDGQRSLWNTARMCKYVCVYTRCIHIYIYRYIYVYIYTHSLSTIYTHTICILYIYLYICTYTQSYTDRFM